jgi:hypothetical protein
MKKTVNGQIQLDEKSYKYNSKKRKHCSLKNIRVKRKKGAATQQICLPFEEQDNKQPPARQ